MSDHVTQILMHNPQALRVEFRLDDQRLLLWWSPRAGRSFACADRNFSNRDNHLDVFRAISLEGFPLADFQGCDYDPYHCVLHYQAGDLHIAVDPERPVVRLWSTAALPVNLKTERWDEPRCETAERFVVLHTQPRDRFHFAAGSSVPAFRHCGFHAPGNSRYALAELPPAASIAIGVGLAEEDDATAAVDAVLAEQPDAMLARIDRVLAPVEALGRVVAAQHPDWEALRRCVIRGLHSMIDESGAFRASIKAIYYLIWVRDAGFAFPYQAAAGWPHKLDELCRLLLANPTTARGAGIPDGRMFAQLINTDYGKYEEDGAYYVIWSLFTRWTQSGQRPDPADLQLVTDAVDWVERYIWDAERGLFGEHFADETAASGARDHGWDYAIGKPTVNRNCIHTKDCIPGGSQAVKRSYDTYINLLMHSAYTMLAGLCTDAAQAGAYTAKAARLWQELEPFFAIRTDGLPTYGELLLEDGSRVHCPHWGPANTVYVWALSMPCFAPLDDWDTIRRRLLQAMMARPRMHWINGICSAVNAIDPWLTDEDELARVI
ncbi:MAG: hypothetical protein ACOCXJ_00680, partial [Planctomycetota bacterium]